MNSNTRVDLPQVSSRQRAGGIKCLKFIIKMLLELMYQMPLLSKHTTCTNGMTIKQNNINNNNKVNSNNNINNNNIIIIFVIIIIIIIMIVVVVY